MKEGGIAGEREGEDKVTSGTKQQHSQEVVNISSKCETKMTTTVHSKSCLCRSEEED
jgi:hypothetical protein